MRDLRRRRGIVDQFLGDTSGWSGVTITNFSPRLLCSISFDFSESWECISGVGLGLFLELSRVVLERVVTYTRSWSVNPTCHL